MHLHEHTDKVECDGRRHSRWASVSTQACMYTGKHTPHTDNLRLVHIIPPPAASMESAISQKEVRLYLILEQSLKPSDTKLEQATVFTLTSQSLLHYKLEPGTMPCTHREMQLRSARVVWATQ